MQQQKKNIVWIASYPKSGNTWFRIFLSNLISNSLLPVNINHLTETPISSNRGMFDSYLGIHTSELTAEEIDYYRPQVYKRLSEDNKNTVFFKTHDAWTLNRNRKPIFSKKITEGVIYIIRNPLDIAVSYSFHNNESIEKTISYLNNSDARLCAGKNKLHPQIQQILSSWSDHVISWVESSKLPIHVIRYEDMLDSPFKTFRSALDFLNLKYEECEVKNAINNSSFDTVKDMEVASGFRERSIYSEVFFRKGRANEWKTVLSKNQKDIIIDHHKEIMRRFGYQNHIDPSQE